jgi:hypothetical protein
MGIQSWKLDLIFAALRSAAVIGGSLIVALAIHPRRVPVPKPKLTARDYVVIENDAADHAPSSAPMSAMPPVPSVDTEVATLPLAAQRSAPQHVEGHPIQNGTDGLPVRDAEPSPKLLQPARPKAGARGAGKKKTTAIVPVSVASAPVDHRQHAARFAVETLRSDPEASLPLTALFAAYKDWCANTGQPMLPENVVGRELAHLFQSAGRSIANGSLIGITIRD